MASVSRPPRAAGSSTSSRTPSAVAAVRPHRRRPRRTSVGEVHLGEVEPEVLRAEPGQVEQVADQPVQPVRLGEHGPAGRPHVLRVPTPSASASAYPFIAVSGVRSSWRDGQQELPLTALAGGQRRAEPVDRLRHLGHLGRSLRLHPYVPAPRCASRLRGRRHVLQRPGQPPGQQHPGQRGADRGRPAGRSAAVLPRLRRGDPGVGQRAGPARRRRRLRSAGPRRTPAARRPRARRDGLPGGHRLPSRRR